MYVDAGDTLVFKFLAAVGAELLGFHQLKSLTKLMFSLKTVTFLLDFYFQTVSNIFKFLCDRFFLPVSLYNISSGTLKCLTNFFSHFYWALCTGFLVHTPHNDKS